MDFGASKFNIFWLILLFGVINLEFAVCYKCEFKDVISYGYYACNIIPDSSIIEEKHVNGKIDDNIEGITFYGTVNGVSHITQSELAFCQRFKNLYKIFVYDVKSVDKNLFHQCRNLYEIWITNSEIEEISEKLFYEQPQLTEIRLNENKLRTLPEDVFTNQKELLYLHLFSNQISCLPSNIFKSLTKLTDLTLFRNNIQELPKNIFVRLENLRELNLHGNQLTTIHADSFGIHKRLFRVDLNANKINAIDEKLIEDTTVKSILMYANVCSKEIIEGRNKIKEKLSTCFKNYRPREEQSNQNLKCLFLNVSN